MPPVHVHDWRALELAPMRSMTFVLADGTQIVRAISECRIALEFGEADAAGAGANDPQSRIG